MNVFISWSGPRSRFLADALRAWLPLVIQSIKPWMSDQDIATGSRWLAEISKKLSDARVGIICVTPENQTSPWLLFEAGALSKTLEQSFVCPILFELSPSQLAGPLAQFQASDTSRDGIEKLLNTLNQALNDNRLRDEDLGEILEVWWPKLSARVREMPSTSEAMPHKRTVENILEEIVENTREQLRRENIRLEGHGERDAKLNEVTEMMNSFMSVFPQETERVKVIGKLLAKSQNLEDMLLVQKESPSQDSSIMHETIRSLDGIHEQVWQLLDGHDGLRLPDLSKMQQIMGSLKDITELDRLLRENLLRPPKDSSGSSGEEKA